MNPVRSSRPETSASKANEFCHETDKIGRPPGDPQLRDLAAGPDLAVSAGLTSAGRVREGKRDIATKMSSRRRVWNLDAHTRCV